MPAPIPNGDTTVKEQPGSPQIEENGESMTATRVWRGLWADLPTPTIGGTYPDILTALKIESYKKTADRGPLGLGTLTVNLSNLSTLEDPIYETEFVELQKDLLTHPRYQSTGAKPLTPADQTAIEIWKNEQNWSRKKAYKFLDDETEETLSANAQDYAQKFLRGTDSYVIYAPVVRATTYHLSRPTVGSVGKKQSPPGGAGAPSGYEWIKTSDRRIFARNRWERHQEWTGADNVDTDIYPT